MSGTESDETGVVPEETGKRSSLSNNTTNPTRPIRFLANPQRLSRGNSNAAFVHEMETVDDSTFSISPSSYGTLEHIQSYKPLCRPDDKSLPKKVR